MKKPGRVAVCSRSFSNHPLLRQELLAEFSDVSFNDSGKTLSGPALADFLVGHEKAIVALENIDEELLKKLPDLKVIGKYGVGLDKLDFAALDKYNVHLGWTPGVNAQAVAELTVGMALNIVRNIAVSNNLVNACTWQQINGRQLSSLQFGIVGCGHVGKAVVKILRAFGCQILVHDQLDVREFCQAQGAQAVSLKDLLAKADVVSVHIPLNIENKNFFGRDILSQMKKGSYLINTARGGLVDEACVLELLESGHLAGAAFDVFAQEPPLDWGLVQHPRMFATGHIGGSSEEAVLAMGRAAIQGLSHFKKASEYGK